MWEVFSNLSDSMIPPSGTLQVAGSSLLSCRYYFVPLVNLRSFILQPVKVWSAVFFSVSIRRFFQNPVVLMTGNPLLSFQASLFVERLYHWFFVSSFCFNSSCSIFDVYPRIVLESCHTHLFFIRTNWMVLREWYDLRNGREKMFEHLWLRTLFSRKNLFMFTFLITLF